ncbi:uncharacterized protein LOC113304574 [Papaver somniferum]|uniref:uncharacterized protein LOC113304574 n=1 Tax=Papaver somniferum TaxID=3469 RepID=UPI000E70225C|nr:uncharacterized protein LOC113304574 [Papaver somniferum]
MATKAEQLPLVLLLNNFPFIPSFQEKFSNQFRTLKRTDLSIPVNEFLKKDCQSVKALVCGAKFAVTKEFLDCLPSLGCMVLTCVGLDNIDMAKRQADRNCWVGKYWVRGSQETCGVQLHYLIHLKE